VFLMVATPLWTPGQPLAVSIVVRVVAGALMAVTAAGLTGFAALRLVRSSRHIEKARGNPIVVYEENR
jgi:hypothetical protein